MSLHYLDATATEFVTLDAFFYLCNKLIWT